MSGWWFSRIPFARCFSWVLLAFGLANAAPHSFTQTAPAPLDREHINEVLRGLNRCLSVGQVAVSPDGKRVAWVQGMREGADIYIAPIDDLARTERISAG